MRICQRSSSLIEFLKAGGRRYIVGTPKSRLKQYERELLGSSWTQIRDGLEVQSVPAEGTRVTVWFPAARLRPVEAFEPVESRRAP